MRLTYLAGVNEFDQSFGTTFAARLIDELGEAGAHEAIDSFLDSLSIVEQAALQYDWTAWARPKQIPPDHDWQSWGHLCGRGIGKTKGISHWVNDEVRAGRAMLICLMAQDEDNCVKLQVTGPSGLIATAPPDFKPVWHVSDLMLTWPNGARAYVRTPEVPGKVRGLEYHLAWLTEMQSWPVATMDEAWSNALISTRLGYARIVWDCTPKKRHPLLKKLLKNHDRDPHSHAVVRGATHENRLNLGDGYIAKLEEEMGGTSRGREELLGEMLDEADGALFKAAWVERNRCAEPERLTRRVIGIDPAVTSRASSDLTGIVVAGLMVDGRAAVLADHSGKHSPAEWSSIALDEYVDGKCDLVIVETNKGGNLLVQVLRASAKERGLEIVLLGKDEPAPGHRRGVVHVREVYGRGEKADRAQPVATAYERNRVCHVNGRSLGELEETLTTWEPTPGSRKSPDRLDALVYAVIELLGLASGTANPSAGIKGIGKLNEMLAKPAAPSNISRMLSGKSGWRL